MHISKPHIKLSIVVRLSTSHHFRPFKEGDWRTRFTIHWLNVKVLILDSSSSMQVSLRDVGFLYFECMRVIIRESGLL